MSKEALDKIEELAARIREITSPLLDEIVHKGDLAAIGEVNQCAYDISRALKRLREETP